MRRDTMTRIVDAINRSLKNNEIETVHIEENVDICDILVEITYDPWDGDVDYAVLGEYEYDVWGWDENTPQNEQEWRIRLIMKG